MHYDFYELALTQPDLEDVVEYLKKPLMILEDIHQRILKLGIQQKTYSVNMEINLSSDKILYKHFPNLLQGYCDLSLDYRNTAIIKKEDKQDYTAKELLLKNLAKLTEEVVLLEKQFNETNSYEFLVQNRIISQLGNQSDLIDLETEKEATISFPNKFNYNTFKDIHKPDFFSPIIKTKNEQIKVKEGEKNDPKFDVFSGDFLIQVSLFILFCFSIYIIYQGAIDRNEKIVKDITTTQSQIKNLYINQATYAGINNDVLIESKILNPNAKENDFFDSNLIISSANIKNVNDSFKISLSNIDFVACEKIVENVNRISTNGSSVIINNKNVIDSSVDSHLICSNHNNYIDLISTKN